ncbi:uncharacterized protein LTR77_002366 [Saxophila tyrrhenica]|uniref:Methyltransferase type 11 domain-containing protein n=1 Tax=Saxophila tyrrhenica TaxID=1690608 RepID=A0AAV9PLU3_9PEZI|nr:hypothetical protein LTR77_002366 [Saxophila tyrrhenica]
MSLNPRAQSGFQSASTYDAHRPTYTPSVITTLLSNLNLAGVKNARIIDLAAGTGKFTEVLAARDEGYEILAVEPHAEMRRVLEGKGLRGVKVVEGRGEDLGVIGDGWADGVVVAQAFHWFANMDALREIHRVLKRHAGFGMVWNVDDYNAPQSHPATTNYESALQSLTWSLDDTDSAPRYRHEAWRGVFDQQSKSSPLSLIIASSSEQLFSLPLAETEEKFEVRLTKEELWERYATLSQVANLGEEEKGKVRSRFMSILEGEDVEVDGEGRVVCHGHTKCVWTGKIPVEGSGDIGDIVGTPPAE